jgi:hypothetical protein
LTYLAHIAQEDDQRENASLDERAHYSAAFRLELRAHLLLEAQISQDEVDLATEVLADLLRAAAGRQLSAARRESVARSPDKPTSVFVFSQTSARVALFERLGQPSLAGFLDYSRRYAESVSERFGYVSLQHLGPDSPPLPLKSIYVEPTLSPVLNPLGGIQRRTHKANESLGSIRLAELLGSSVRAVVLGPAGVGKSTLVKHAANLLSSSDPRDPIVPFVLELKLYQGRAADELGLFMEHIRRDLTVQMQEEPPEGWLEYVLLTGRATVFFDGFDEVLNGGERSRIRDAIASFAQRYPQAGVVVTTRIIGYAGVPFSSQQFLHAAIDDFDTSQVEQYAKNWFSSHVSKRFGEDESRLVPFLSETKKHAVDLRSNPLMLSLLCGVYYHQGDIPRTIAELYERCASLMFQQWSTMRGLADPGIWNQDLKPALFHIAGRILDQTSFRQGGIPEAELVRELQEFFESESTIEPDAARERAVRLVEQWAGRAWVMAEVGRDEYSRPRFGFVHQSFLEYFAAVNLVRKAEGPRELFEGMRRKIIFLNGWSVGQIAVSALNQYRSGGASRFAGSLLDNLNESSERERLHLLLFCLSLTDFVDLSREVDIRLTDAVLAQYARSLISPKPGMNLSGLHELTRRLTSGPYPSPEFADREDYFDDDEYLDQEEYFDSIAADRLLTPIDTEPALEALVLRALALPVQLALLEGRLGSFSTWESAPAQAFVTACMTIAFVRAAESRGDIQIDWDEFGGLQSLYDRVEATDSYWIAHSAAYALGLVDRVRASALLPWNAAFSRESVVLSLVVDFDQPSVIGGKVPSSFLSEEAAPVLLCLGSSFLSDYLSLSAGQGFDQISLEDAPVTFALVADDGKRYLAEDLLSATEGHSGTFVLEPGRAFFVPKSEHDEGLWNGGGWKIERLAGFFVVLAVFSDLDPEFRPSRFAPGGALSRKMRALLKVVDDRQARQNDERSIGEVMEAFGHEPLGLAMIAWKGGHLRLTS